MTDLSLVAISLITESIVLLLGVVVCALILRWALRINEIVSLQKEILANLRHINAQTKQND